MLTSLIAIFLIIFFTATTLLVLIHLAKTTDPYAPNPKVH